MSQSLQLNKNAYQPSEFAQTPPMAEEQLARAKKTKTAAKTGLTLAGTSFHLDKPVAVEQIFKPTVFKDHSKEGRQAFRQTLQEQKGLTEKNHYKGCVPAAQISALLRMTGQDVSKQTVHEYAEAVDARMESEALSDAAVAAWAQKTPEQRKSILHS